MSISSYDIDGVTTGLTAGTDYWLYPEPTRAYWIEFNGAPANDKQNIQITYNYGETNVLVNQLSLYMSAREVILEHMAKTVQRPGVYTGPQKEVPWKSQDKHKSLLVNINTTIEELERELGYKNRIGLV